MGKSPSPLRRGAIYAAALLCAALPSLAQSGKTLRGKIETPNGGRVGVAVLVTVEGQQSGASMNAPVDSDGNFEFSGLQADTYTVTVKAEHFQTYRTTVNLSSMFVPSFYVDIYLISTHKLKVDSAGEPPLSDLAAPRNARREFEEAKRDWQKNKLKDERKHLERAVGDYPCYARAQDVLAELDRAEKDLAGAEADYQQAIKCDATFRHALYGLADLYLAENKPAESEALLLHAQRLAPGDWMLSYELGASHFAMNEFAKAAQDFVVAESLHPDMPASFHVQLANAYLKTGEYGKVLEQLDTYLRLSPNGPYSGNARKMAATLRQRGVTP